MFLYLWDQIVGDHHTILVAEHHGCEIIEEVFSMLKDLLPIMTEEEKQQHSALAQKGHLSSKDIKVFQLLDEKKRESVLSHEERRAYDELRRLENPSDLQKRNLIIICNKAGIDVPKNLSSFSKKLRTSLNREEELRLAELTVSDVLNSDEEKEFRSLSNKLPQKTPMKYHNLLIYFSLFISSLFSIVTGLRYLTGHIYADEAFSIDQIYTVFPVLKLVDISYGVICLGLAVYTLYTRQRLAHLKENGPVHLRSLFILSLVTSFAYLLVVSMAMNLPVNLFINSDQWISWISWVILLMSVRIYYNKRKSMFIN